MSASIHTFANISLAGDAARELSPALSGICGEPQVADTADSRTVAPADAEQASAVLKQCSTAGIAVNVQGAGTKQDWLEPARFGVRLTTTGMSRVLEHVWQDMTCTVEAGSTWKAMQDTLAAYGQCVALDPLWPERATVGGVVAANDSGALRLRYGGVRDLVIGMTLVLPDGTVARSGGKVVKNVAGYDLPKLLCGSFGTLGLITEVTFRLHAVAQDMATWTILATTAELLGKLLLRLLDLRFSLQSMQMRGWPEGFALDVRLSSMPAVLVTQGDALQAVAATFGLSAHAAGNETWAAREAVFQAGRSQAVLKISALPSMTAQLAQRVADLGGIIVAQATGLMFASLPLASFAEIHTLRATVEGAGGSLLLLRNPPGSGLDRWGTLPANLPLMQAVQRQFDPLGTLNPQRYLRLSA